MNFLHSKKGYTLIELLAVLAILMIIATISLSVFSDLDRISDNRVDQSRILIYNKAFEDFRFTDYSTLQSTPDDQVVIVQGGKVKINQYLNLTMEDVEALSSSGKGRYPQTKRECVAVIRAYCGTNEILPFPALGMSYSYFYHIPEGKCYVKATSDVSPLDTDWINLNEYYTLISSYVLGDVDGNKVIDNRDLGVLARVVAGTHSFSDPYLYSSADVNQDGNVNSDDYTYLNNFLTNNGKEPKWK